ncbi:MAG: diguanylate cyclase [Burkholderiales bacterium RIFCSPLOWO2_02_FULL_57_36]|nr:MAG: diguanylate cyclase [Burkholderiales bacterium RIFCSPLOWO2_02_FULL_57_36]
MTTDAEIELPKSTKTNKSLTKVLNQSARIKEVVEECAEELSSVNTVLQQELADSNALPDVKNALQKSGTIETKVHEAAGELSLVNQALEDEVKERQMLEHQLVAVKKQEEAARHAAFHDPLTGLPNRVLFSDRLEHGVAQAKRHGWSIALMFVDLNDFKSINDSYGHDVGDRVLEIISQRLKDSTRADDTVSRHGGDEFLYLLMEIRDEQDIVVIAEKILKALEEPCDINMRGLAISPLINASIGISIFPKNALTADDLIKCADKAMFRAKRTRSGYAFAR